MKEKKMLKKQIRNDFIYLFIYLFLIYDRNSNSWTDQVGGPKGPNPLWAL